MTRAERGSTASCPGCRSGRWWLSPDGGRVQLCEQHEDLIAGEKGWRWAEPMGC